jgi:PAS domain S-box-containing protein/putative nucleotidyltransferase with HDIG domain
MRNKTNLQDLLLCSIGEGISTVDLQGRATFVNPAAARMLGWEVAELLGKHLHTVVRHTRPDGTPYPEEACPVCASLRNGNAHHVEEEVFWRKDGTAFPVEYTSTPIRVERGRIIGAAVIFQDITARKRVQEQARCHFERLAALRAIDVAILTSRDLRFTLSVVVDQALALLGADAAAILLLNPTTQTLDYVSRRGLLVGGAISTCLRPEVGYAGQIIQEGRAIIDLDFKAVQELHPQSNPMAAEGFQEYYGIPLIARGQAKGVLEIYCRTSRRLDEDWIGFLETLAGQAAIAIDSAALLDDLQRINRELIYSYDATVEGWSRTLELRDHETEGHSMRVTEMTLRLAEKMGVSAEEQVHMRRGALLHDIGKMGVPDSILMKPGPLTSEEWRIMRKHPEYAYELLHPIPFLHPALDIPLCHHERWDGDGYPHGLRGEQIPLAARIFAVVDVWDALRFDRPYRPGWPPEQIREHIAGLSGSHFDPTVVEAFLTLITEESPSCLAPVLGPKRRKQNDPY